MDYSPWGHQESDRTEQQQQQDRHSESLQQSHPMSLEANEKT